MKLRVPGQGPNQNDQNGDQDGHIGELRLRQLQLGELDPAQSGALEQHLVGCPACRQKREALDLEQRAFVQAIPFPRFAGGVERAARVPRPAGRTRRAILFTTGGLGLAAAAGLLLLLRGGGAENAWQSEGDGSGNRIKGGSPTLAASVRIASADGRQQRSADPGSTTRLAPGERLRLAATLPGTRHLLAVSLDDAGLITALHGQGGDSNLVPASPGSAPLYLPDSFQLTGAGQERVYLFASAFPFSGQAVADALKQAHSRAGGTLARMAPPLLPAEVVTFTWLFEKP